MKKGMYCMCEKKKPGGDDFMDGDSYVLDLIIIIGLKVSWEKM